MQEDIKVINQFDSFYAIMLRYVYRIYILYPFEFVTNSNFYIDCAVRRFDHFTWGVFKSDIHSPRAIPA